MGLGGGTGSGLGGYLVRKLDEVYYNTSQSIFALYPNDKV